MNTMNGVVSKNIKRLREEQKLSLDELARRSGVSKSMLAQIERGDGNPTLLTLCKISNGMNVPFDALTLRPQAPYEIVNLAQIQPFLEDSGKVKNYAIFPDDENRRFAVYYLELQPGISWQADPHIKETTEFITVLSGSIEIRVGEHRLIVEEEESVRFRSDRVHAYRNIGEGITKLHMILFTP